MLFGHVIMLVPTVEYAQGEEKGGGEGKFGMRGLEENIIFKGGLVPSH